MGSNRFTELRQKAGLTVAEAAEKTGYSERVVYRWETGEKEPRRSVLETLEKCIRGCSPSSSNPAFRFIDLFAGIGGLRLGFEAIGGQCVFTCERDKYSQATYRANFSGDDHKIFDDIMNLMPEEVPEHDVLLAGFPCQPFSIAGVSKKNALKRPHGFACEAQGTLFFRLAQIIRDHRPAAFMLENVKNLIGHDKGQTFRVIRQVLEEELGYQIDWRVIDGKSWVPQHRERIFIVGFRDPSAFSFDDIELPDRLSGPRMSSVLHAEDGSEAPEKHYTVGNIGRVSDKYVLSEKLWDYLQGYAAKHKAAGNGFGFGLVGPEDTSRTLSARYYKDGSEILVRREGGRPRRLTPRECARLMGFDNGDRIFNIPVSDTQAYKQFGNAVVVPAVEAVARHMEPHIHAALEREKEEKVSLPAPELPTEAA